MLFFASDKAKQFVKNFFNNSILDDSGFSLSAFPSRTNMKMLNIHVTTNLVKVINDFDSSKPFGRDCSCDGSEKLRVSSFTYRK